MNESYVEERSFEWQIGYATFSADYRYLESIKQYIRNQKHHHGYAATSDQNESFEAEYAKQLIDFGFEVHPEYTFPVAPVDRFA